MIGSSPMRGRILIPERGRVLRAGTSFPRTVGATRRRPATFLALLVLLPLFGETFQYVTDIPALYALTKAWPLLMLPLAAWGAAALGLPYRLSLMAALFCGLAVGPFAGLVVLGNDALGAAASTAKIWPLLNGFSLAAMLVLLSPGGPTLRRAILTLGALTLAAFVLLALVAPANWYNRDVLETKIFLWDQERGYRLYIPSFFGFLALLLTVRAFRRRPTWTGAVAIVAGFLVMILLYKQRMPVAATLGAIVIGIVLNARRWRPLLIVIAGAAATIAAIPVFLYVRSESFAARLGGSLSARQDEAATAIAFLRAHPLGILTGVGSATRVGGADLGAIVGSHYFYLTDLGWLGVVFEYGLVGSAAFLILVGAGLRVSRDAARGGDLLAGACFDYIVFFLLNSAVTSVVFAPGELVFCMAVADHVRRSRAQGPAAQ